jgi:hypothetical protein
MYAGFYAFVLLALVGGFLRRRALAGPVLVDLGRDRHGPTIAALGGGLLVMAGIRLASATAGDPVLTPSAAGPLAVSLACAVFCVTTGLTPIQMRAGGILGGFPLYPHFLEWTRVEGWEIAGPILAITARGRWSLLGRVWRYKLTVRVPAAQRAAVEALLAERAPQPGASRPL